MQIIKDGKLLAKEQEATIRLYASAHAKLHICVVSGLWHAAVHGDPVHLNRLYSALKTNDQSAVKMYVRRVHAIIGLAGDVPDGKDKEIVQAAIEAGTVLGFADGAFTIKRGPKTVEAKALSKMAEERFANPDNKRDFEVFERNVLSEVQTLNDKEVLTRFLKLVKEMGQGNTERRKVAVSERVTKLFKPVANQAEAMLNQLTEFSPVASTDAAPVKSAKPKAKAKAKASNKVVAAKAAPATSSVETVN